MLCVCVCYHYTQRLVFKSKYILFSIFMVLQTKKNYFQFKLHLTASSMMNEATANECGAWSAGIQFLNPVRLSPD